MSLNRERYLALLLLSVLLPAGCATNHSRPRSREPKVVHVSRLCNVEPLGPPPRLARRSCGPGKEGWSCFDGRDAARMEAYVAAMERWIQTARRNCRIREVPSRGHHSGAQRPQPRASGAAAFSPVW